MINHKFILMYCYTLKGCSWSAWKCMVAKHAILKVIITTFIRKQDRQVKQFSFSLQKYCHWTEHEHVDWPK